MQIGTWTPGSGVFVIAEIGSNHNGSLETANRLIDEAAATGVDAVKFQRYDASRLVHKDVPTMAHVSGVHKTQRERMRSLEFDDAGWQSLAARAAGHGMIFMASAFDERSADALAPLVPAWKVASGDLTHLPLIRHLARAGKPILMSTGMASEHEIAEAVQAAGKDRTALLYCISRYPTPAAELDLLTITWLAERFDVPVGYSDHTIGLTASVAAVALGATIIEKHFTLDRTQPLGDHKLSSEPAEMKELVARVREAHAMRGQVRIEPRPEELAMRRPMRRGLRAARDMAAGHVLTEGDLIALRPEEGLPPSRLESLVGRRLREPVAAEAVVAADLVE